MEADQKGLCSDLVPVVTLLGSDYSGSFYQNHLVRLLQHHLHGAVLKDYSEASDGARLDVCRS